MDDTKLAELHKKMTIDEWKQKLTPLWTVCSDGRTDPLDYLISGIGPKGTVRGNPGTTGTETRIHFGRKDSRFV